MILLLIATNDTMVWVAFIDQPFQCIHFNALLVIFQLKLFTDNKLLA